MSINQVRHFSGSLMYLPLYHRTTSSTEREYFQQLCVCFMNAVCIISKKVTSDFHIELITHLEMITLKHSMAEWLKGFLLRSSVLFWTQASHMHIYIFIYRLFTLYLCNYFYYIYIFCSFFKWLFMCHVGLTFKMSDYGVLFSTRNKCKFFCIYPLMLWCIRCIDDLRFMLTPCFVLALIWSQMLQIRVRLFIVKGAIISKNNEFMD